MANFSLLWLGLLLSGSICAQKTSYKVLLLPIDKAEPSFSFNTQFKNKEEASAYFSNLLPQMQAKGYWSASIDSLSIDSAGVFAAIYTGTRYQLKKIILPAEFTAFIEGTGSTKGKKKSIEEGDLTHYREQLLNYFEESGYPFARVGFDSIHIEGQEVVARMHIDKGNIYKIDSFSQQGSLRLQSGFLHRYLDLEKGAPYQKSKLEKIDQRLNELSFAAPGRSWDLSMLGTGAVVNVYLEPKRSNILNVLLGVMPVSTQTPENALQVTGDVNMLLRNSFRMGETLGINWQQIQYKSPRLNLIYQQPYLFDSKAGIDFSFELFKKDTQFVNLQIQLGVPYQFSLTQSGKLFLLRQQTNVTFVDTAFVRQNRKLPDLAGVNATSFGLDYQWNTTDYRLNPRRGNEIELSILGGTKKIVKSNDIENLKDRGNPGFDFASLYDTLKLNTFQAKIKLKAAHYIPTGRATVLKLGLAAGWYESGNYFRNELFQMGGFRLLRGFDEESIFARNYAVATAEYRLLSGKNAYFFGFLDAGYAGYRDEVQSFDNNFIGTGLGLALETKNSIINISWAIGKRNDLPLDLRQSKIHLGFINFF